MSVLCTCTSQLQIVLRWLAGMALVFWRYLWETTPLHRTEEVGDGSDLPPELPEELVDDRSQLLANGVGPVFHRRFSVRITDSALTAPELVDAIAADMNRAVPREVTKVRTAKGPGDRTQVGDEVVVHMPGPWDAPVRVVARMDDSFRLATLRGHLESGLIEFRTRSEGSGLVFEIEAWARASTPLLNVLYGKLRVAKEMQFNMWVRCCLAAAALARGRPQNGVTIRTRRHFAPRL
ncbi:DUF1990 family protein [Saccharopolyspora hattusasensis]|uniref:DUF1990 family protein n=1 Tax=Saccharopolyspora hattusasensis TaxID=1128679 RepID=UPI003D97E9F6